MNKKIFTSFTILIIGLIFVRVGIVPKYSQYKRLHNQFRAVQQTLSAKQKYYSQLFTIREKLNASQKAVAKVSAALPLNPDAPALYKFLKEEASQNGLVLRSLGELKTVASSNNSIGIIKFQGLVEGNYKSLVSFLEAVENSSRLINVMSVRLLPGGKEESSKQKTATFVPRYFLNIEARYTRSI